MKRFLVLVMCIMLLCAMPIVASAESGVDAPATEEVLPSTEPAPETEKPMTEVIVDYVKSHIEEISVIMTLLLTIFYEIRKHSKLNLSIGTLNKNAVTAVTNSEEAMRKAAEQNAAALQEVLAEATELAIVVKNYKEEFGTLLAEVRKSAEEKKNLEETLAHVETFLKTSKLATIELANEVADLLVLANIPNTKKEELYSRHRAAVDAIAVAENTEVKVDDGEQA